MTPIRILRWLPFLGFASASIWWTSRAPRGRKPASMAMDVSPEALLLALTKWPHMASMAFLYVLAVLAFSPRRAGLAGIVTFAIGLAWEIVQTTVIGHNARLADLLPNAVAVLACVALTRWLSRRQTLSAW